MLSSAKSVVQDRLLITKVTTTTNTPVSGPQLAEIEDIFFLNNKNKLDIP